VTPAEPGTLSDAEQQLWDAFPRGRTVTFPAPPEVRARVIRALLAGARPAEPGHRALSLHRLDWHLYLQAPPSPATLT
jgi:hypothetical protein